ETTPGGRALKFWASVRVSVNRGKHIEDKDKTVIGHYMNINCIKNKVAPPYRKCSVGLMYGEGLVETESLIDILCKEGKIEVVKQGSYKIVGTEDIIRGKANVLKKLDGKNILFNDTNVVGET
ncbi:MAG: DNA recombination/repair protein RecA, partial [Candidatus Dojkabacteria bacterium]